MIEFPCEFPIKIMAVNRAGVVDELIAIAQQHHPELLESSIKQQLSKNGTYLSITLNVYAQSQSALDALYRELTQHPDIKMVL